MDSAASLADLLGSVFFPRLVPGRTDRHFSSFSVVFCRPVTRPERAGLGGLGVFWNRHQLYQCPTQQALAVTDDAAPGEAISNYLKSLVRVSFQ